MNNYVRLLEGVIFGKRDILILHHQLLPNGRIGDIHDKMCDHMRERMDLVGMGEGGEFIDR